MQMDRVCERWIVGTGPWYCGAREAPGPAVRELDGRTSWCWSSIQGWRSRPGQPFLWFCSGLSDGLMATCLPEGGVFTQCPDSQTPQRLGFTSSPCCMVRHLETTLLG